MWSGHCIIKMWVVRITHQIFRTLLMIYRTDNYVPIDGCAQFVVELMSRPCLGKEADERLYKRITAALREFSRDGTNLREREFCEMMVGGEV